MYLTKQKSHFNVNQRSYCRFLFYASFLYGYNEKLLLTVIRLKKYQRQLLVFEFDKLMNKLIKCRTFNLTARFFLIVFSRTSIWLHHGSQHRTISTFHQAESFPFHYVPIMLGAIEAIVSYSHYSQYRVSITLIVIRNRKMICRS